jgi:hypothetical protein
MADRRTAFADALARLVFRKSPSELSDTERADLELLRALEGDAADEVEYEGLSNESSAPLMLTRRSASPALAVSGSLLEESC